MTMTADADKYISVSFFFFISFLCYISIVVRFGGRHGGVCKTRDVKKLLNQVNSPQVGFRSHLPFDSVSGVLHDGKRIL